jgi:addiction module RelE/StbE family toxin
LYSLELEEEVFKVFKKLARKDRKQLEAINKRIEQILADPFQFKPLKHPLEGLWRVHIGSFVLIYEVLETSKTVRVLKYKIMTKHTHDRYLFRYATLTKSRSTPITSAKIASLHRG